MKDAKVVTTDVRDLTAMASEKLGIKAIDILPDSKFIGGFLSEGYTVRDFLTRDRAFAKGESAVVRATEDKQAIYVPLHAGWFGILERPNSEKESVATRPAASAKPDLMIEIEGFKGTMKEARRFAQLLLDACKNAKFEAELAEKLAEKSGE